MRFPARLALLLALLVAAPATHATVFVVDSIEDGSDGDLTDDACKDAAGACTLRAAIEQANATAGADRVEFAIPGAGPHVIRPVAALPTISEGLVIDGYTQPGASPNTLPAGTNAQLEIALDGASSQGVFGIDVGGATVALRGLAIRNFALGVRLSLASVLSGNRIELCSTGVSGGPGFVVGGVARGDRNLISNNGTGISLTSQANFVVNNLIGTDASGSAPLGNNQGITITGGSFNAVTDNVISGNVFGVVLGFSTGNTFVRNLIGLSADGRTALGNSVGLRIGDSGQQVGVANANRPHVNANVISANGTGLQLRSGGNSVEGNYFGTGPGGSGVFGNGDAIVITSSDNVIGAPATARGEPNVIAFSTRNGITLPGSANPPLNNSLRTNEIYGNARFDVDLGDDGAINDDLGDVDAGPNNLQNPPTLDSVTASAGQTAIEGKLDADVGPYMLDFYSSAACDAGADSGSGRFFLGSDSVFVNAGGATFSVVLPTTAQGHAFTAMATDSNGNSSELGPCFDAGIAGGANLSVSVAIDASQAVVAPGDAVQFEVTASNAGPATATQVPVRVARPAGFASWASSGAGSYDEASGVWSVGDLTPGASASRSFDATVDAAAAGPLTVLADAEQNLSEPDPDLSGNRSSGSFDVRAGADLVVTQSLPTSAQPGSSISLSVDVRNDGPEDAVGVIVSGQLEAGLELEVASAPPGITYNAATGNWSLAVGDLAEGQSVQLTLPVRVSATTLLGVGLKHTFRAFSPLVADPAPGLSTAIVGAGTTADLVVRSVDKPSQFPFRWRLNVENLGPYALSYFVLRIDLVPRPASIEVQDAAKRTICPASAAPTFCRIPAPPAGTGVDLDLVSVGTQVEVSASLESDPSSPFFDPDTANNQVSWINPAENGCGLLGIEAPLILGLAALLRGRKGRAALRRIFPGSALALALLLGGSAREAEATPLTFAVDSAASSATVAIASSLGAPPPAPVSLSGSVDADLALGSDALFGLVASSLQLTGGAIALSDSSILLESFPLYDLAFAWNGIVASATGPAASGFPVAPGLSLFDVVGSSLSFGAGTIDATGTYFGLPVSETLDLATLPFSSTFPANSVAQLEVTDLGGGVAALRLTMPFAATLQLAIDTEPVVVTIAGTLVLAGQHVPEPGIALLLGAAGALGLARFGRSPRRPPASRRCHQFR